MYLIVGVIITLLVVSFYRSITTSDTNGEVNNVSVDTVDVSTSHRDNKDQSQVHVKSISSFDWKKHKWDFDHKNQSHVHVKSNSSFDWEAHETRLKYKSGYSNRDIDLIEWKVKKDTYYLQGVEDGLQMIEELKEYSERLKKHVSVENFKEIPRDPEQQTELQKLIVNSPPIPRDSSPTRNYIDWVVEDPETGMYYTKTSGCPTLPPEWGKERLEYGMDSTSSIPYDYSRGSTYNLLRKLIIGTDLT